MIRRSFSSISSKLRFGFRPQRTVLQCQPLQNVSLLSSLVFKNKTLFRSFSSSFSSSSSSSSSNTNTNTTSSTSTSSIQINEKEKDAVREDLFRLSNSHRLLVSIYAAVHLNIFEQLTPFSSNNPISVDTIAKNCNCQSDPLYRVLRYLSVNGYGQEHSNKCFSHSKKSEILVNSNLKFSALVLGGDVYIRTISGGNISKVLQKTTPEKTFTCSDSEYGAPIFDVVNNPTKHGLDELVKDRYSKYFQSMTDPKDLENIAKSFNFGKYNSVADIGGSMGYILATILKTHPNIKKGYLFDLPQVVEIAKKQSGNNPKVEFVTGNFFEKVPVKSDVYFMRYILHDWSDKECIQILSNIRKSCNKNAKLVIVESGLFDEPDTSPFITWLDVHMLYATGGRERSVAEFDAIFEASGFKRKDPPIVTKKFGLVVAEAV